MNKILHVSTDTNTTSLRNRNSLHQIALKELEDQITSLISESNFGIVTTNDTGHCLDINGEAMKLIGCISNDPFEIQLNNDLFLKQNWESLRESIEKIHSENLDRCDVLLPTREGNTVYLSILSRKIKIKGKEKFVRRSIFFQSQVNFYKSISQDISSIAFQADVGICISDEQGSIILANKEFQRLIQCDQDLLRGKNILQFFEVFKEDLGSEDNPNNKIFLENWNGEVKRIKSDGYEFNGWLRSTTVSAFGDVKKYHVIFLNDITELRQSRKKIYDLAYFDSLTHLPNRRKLFDRISRLLESMQRSHLNAAVLFIDLDNFKVINDSKGHAVGDKLLIEASKRLCEAVREFDTVARLGGDEFVVLLTELDGNNKKAFNQASIIGNKILSSLADRYLIEDLTLTCSASIGIAVFNGFDTTDDILKHADMAMYQAKRKGRNSICFFDLELKRIVTDYANLEQSLSRALELNQLEIYFQPIVTTEGVITRAEVLLRWNHPTRGLISPIDFIGIAEESGLVVPIGIWVLEKTCEQLSQWKSIPFLKEIQLSVNVSSRQFKDHEFINKFTNLIELFNINPSLLKLELTETAVYNPVEATSIMATINALGVKFSLDDFGTGYSSLSSLTRLPLHQIKIDRTFIDHMFIDSKDNAVVKTIIALAKNLGLEIVAEGIENLEQWNVLSELGCDLFQGYFFSLPLTKLDFQTLIEKSCRKTAS